MTWRLFLMAIGSAAASCWFLVVDAAELLGSLYEGDFLDWES